MISEEVGAAKPHKEIFDTAFALMGNPKRDEVMIIGDSLTSDIKGGNNYGIATCWFNPAHLPNGQDVVIHHNISHLNEILSIVGE